MWFSLNIPDLISIHNLDKFQMPSVADTPQNMEFTNNVAKKLMTVQFFYPSGGDEKMAVVTVRSGVVSVGRYSGRLFQVNARNVSLLKQSIREFKLQPLAKNKSNLYLCENAIEVHENEFIPKPKSGNIRVSQSQRLETRLGVMSTESIEEMISVLESASNLGFKNVDQLRVILELFNERNN